MVNIHSFRVGHATNSSSSHSLVFSTSDVKDVYGDSGNFGWDDFILASKESKEEYIAVMIRYFIQHLHSGAISVENLPEELIYSWMNYFGIATKVDIEQYIDHQSVPTFPRDIITGEVSILIMRHLFNFILQPGMIILGGNDNCDNNLVPSVPYTKISSMCDLLGTNYYSDSDLYCRYDEQYNYWTIYSKERGIKMRLSFTPMGYKLKPSRSSIPDLVDIKITNKCNKGCKFCYMDSSGNGKHADTDYVLKMIRTFKEAGVFEIVLGGGEPTLHPAFTSMLSYANGSASFSTATLDWLDDPNIVSYVNTHALAFAYTPETMDDVYALHDKITKLQLWEEKRKHRIKINVIAGVHSSEFFDEIQKKIDNLGLGIILLGYKSVGRGSSYKPVPYAKDVRKLLRSLRYSSNVHVDTVIAKEFSAILDKEYGDYLYDKVDGKFSMFIDGVNKTFKPSSYTEGLGCPVTSTNVLNTFRMS